MPSQDANMKQPIRERFANVARWFKAAHAFPVGPESAKSLRDNAHETNGSPLHRTLLLSTVAPFVACDLIIPIVLVCGSTPIVQNSR